MELDLKETATPEGAVVETFICRCGTAQNQQAEALQAEVRERLTQGSDELMAREVADNVFITMIVQSLEWDFNHVRVTGIWNDQWTLITASDYAETVEVKVQCDYVEDGFAAIWKIYADRKR
jgi:hypothetical protein